MDEEMKTPDQNIETVYEQMLEDSNPKTFKATDAKVTFENGQELELSGKKARQGIMEHSVTRILKWCFENNLSFCIEVTPETSRLVQELAFEHDITWPHRDKAVGHTKSPLLVIKTHYLNPGYMGIYYPHNCNTYSEYRADQRSEDAAKVPCFSDRALEYHNRDNKSVKESPDLKHLESVTSLSAIRWAFEKKLNFYIFVDNRAMKYLKEIAEAAGVIWPDITHENMPCLIFKRFNEQIPTFEYGMFQSDYTCIGDIEKNCPYAKSAMSMDELVDCYIS